MDHEQEQHQHEQEQEQEQHQHEKEKEKEQEQEHDRHQHQNQREDEQEDAAPDGTIVDRVDVLFNEFKARREGLLEAFNSDLSTLLKEGKEITMRTPYLQRKVLCGLPDGKWILQFAEYHNPKQHPQPQPLLAFGKDVHWHEWASRMADLSDAWLIALSGYQSKSLNPQERLDLMDKISSFSSLKDEMTPECPVANQFDMNEKPPVFKPECVSRRSEASSCMRRGCNFVTNDTVRDHWIQCDNCYLWYHCNCHGLSLDQAKKLQSYRCSKC